ncbi:hypothetical protein METHB2_530012 [Candidatus Methylobacter favarea]|uniref:GmrSD restriction endonucleases N-terminal domain-containing protein n=1 Tax=Candidatus Methylobacter favarea TaxID=2707345 RepID=A0A8S0YAI1_9GAMM|nr:DUF262 domain-containing protein [Candidatus Methylobacter favarea]CAA9891937.1 hypothetical protein METHB2_530012 [Candidatus Methylobacter favarea]
MQKYSVNQHLIETLLSYVRAGEIAIPEIQRPFVWDSSKVRDLMDSLYQGYPIGYVIAWQNPNVRLKNGGISQGKKILIDGQQRVTALTAAILGEYVVNKTYQRVKIKIAFNPMDEIFEVQNSAMENYQRHFGAQPYCKAWIHQWRAVLIFMYFWQPRSRLMTKASCQKM